MLRGELVTLRAFRTEDLDALTEFQNDVETELLGGGAAPAPITREAVAEMWAGRVAERSSVVFIIEADDVVIGNVGLFNADSLARTIELGITIGHKDYWGRGYGTDAVRLAVDYAFRMRNIRKVHLSVLANNPRAVAAYGKAGFVEEGRQREQAWSNGEYVDLIAMGCFRQDRG